MGNVVARLSHPRSPTSSTFSKSDVDWDDTHDYASTIHHPIPEAIITATENGMIGENLLFVDGLTQNTESSKLCADEDEDWPLRKDSVQSTGTADSDSVGSVSERQEQVLEHRCYYTEGVPKRIEGLVSHERCASCGKRWRTMGVRDGVGEDGTRHVRWKGLDA